MAVIEPEREPGAGPEQAESSTRKRRRASFTVTVWHALFINWLSQANRTAVLHVNKEWIQHMVKFMTAHASNFFVPKGPKRSRLTIREEIEPTKMLKFVGPMEDPIYTNRTLTDKNGQPVQVQLIDIKTGQICADPFKVEIVVLDGDFCPDDLSDWSSEQFNASILGPRKQKGPLLVSKKEKVVKRLENGKVVFGDLEITDNSTLAKNRKFRLGARVVHGGPRILEAWTEEEFRVLESRLEKLGKHGIPSPGDEVCRLINIGKTYHNQLISIGIETVQDFLKLLEEDSQCLMSTLRMPESKWQSTVQHAQKCLDQGETRMLNPVGNETEGPELAEPSTRKRKRTSFTQTVWHALFINWLSQADATVVLVNMESVEYMIEFMTAHAGIFVAEGAKRSRVMIQQEVEPPPQQPTELLRTQEVEPPPQPPTKMLRFAGPLKEPIYTNRTLTHKNGQPVQVQLVDIETGQICTDPFKVEIVVLDGDFCPDDQRNWSSEQFNASIMGPRKQKGPLLVSKKERVAKRLKNGRADFGDLKITDNSTVAKNKMFRLGARVVHGGPSILEAWTEEEIRVKDVKCEGAKHEIPFLDDEVWRLINIGKKCHEKLVSIGIKTVQDLLNSVETNLQFLKTTLGLSEKKCKETIENARRASMYKGEASMSNAEENGTQRNLVPQVVVPTETEVPPEIMGLEIPPSHPMEQIPPHPMEQIPPHSIEEISLENMDISQQIEPSANLEFSLEDLLNGWNEGEATLQGAEPLNSEEWADACLATPESSVEA